MKSSSRPKTIKSSISSCSGKTSASGRAAKVQEARLVRQELVQRDQLVLQDRQGQRAALPVSPGRLVRLARPAPALLVQRVQPDRLARLAPQEPASPEQQVSAPLVPLVLQVQPDRLVSPDHPESVSLSLASSQTSLPCRRHRQEIPSTRRLIPAISGAGMAQAIMISVLWRDQLAPPV